MLSSSADKSTAGKDDFFAIRFPFRRKICSGVIWGKYCGAKGNWPANWPDGNWLDGNWEELPIEFCEDGVEGFEDDD
ncbi:hypothetical protein Tco_0618855 [Tanacetum coccineum]